MCSLHLWQGSLIFPCVNSPSSWVPVWPWAKCRRPTSGWRGRAKRSNDDSTVLVLDCALCRSSVTTRNDWLKQHASMPSWAQTSSTSIWAARLKVCQKAAGSALLADEPLVGRILEAVVNAVEIPVTLKIRTGTDPEHRNGVTIARMAESAGIQMLTVHGRTRADRFKGAAEYDSIADTVQAVSIPVIANGDIQSARKAREVLALTGAAGVMIGRGAQGQLWLPGAIAEALATGDGEERAPSPTEQLTLHHRHIDALHAFYGDVMGPRIARKHHAWFLESLVSQQLLDTDTARADRQRFNALETPEAQQSHLHHMATQRSSMLALAA